jgi:hypothetical protein
MDDQTRPLAETVKRMSDEELAAFRADKGDTSLSAIMAEREFERRARLEQHRLDLDLVLRQVQWMKFAAILGSVATLIGAIVGALLIFWLQNNPP